MRRILLAAFGDPGHAFPVIALGAELARRGHDVSVQTWAKWQTQVEAEGITFVPAMEYQVFPTEDRPLKPYEAVTRAARDTVPQIEEVRPEVVISDIITLAPALAGEMLGLPVATLVPHVDPRPADGFPAYSIGARLPRTELGRGIWRYMDRFVQGGLVQGRDQLNETRRRLGLPPRDHVHNGISHELCLVATLPELEYPRADPYPNTHVVGPLLWEIPGEEGVAAAAGGRTGRARRAVDVAGPRAPDAARRARGPGRRAGARDRDVEPARSGPAARRARQRRRRRLALLREDDAALRRRPLPRRPRHRRARAGQRRARRCAAPRRAT